MIVEKECRCCYKSKSIEEDLCVYTNCMKTDDGKVVAIREYTREHPNATTGEICKSLDISFNDISRLIDDGKVISKPNAYNREFEVIKQYLALNPNAMVHEISAYTRVSTEIINDLIDQGRFIRNGTGLKINKNLNKTSNEIENSIQQLYKVGKNMEKSKRQEENNARMIQNSNDKNRGHGYFTSRGRD